MYVKKQWGAPSHDGKKVKYGCNLIPVKHLKSCGGLGGGAARPMMIQKVMIQLGAKNVNSSGGVGQAPPRMIEKVMIHL